MMDLFQRGDIESSGDILLTTLMYYLTGVMGFEAHQSNICLDTMLYQYATVANEGHAIARKWFNTHNDHPSCFLKPSERGRHSGEPIAIV